MEFKKNCERKIIAKCKRGKKSAASFGYTKRSETISLAILTKVCSCGATSKKKNHFFLSTKKAYKTWVFHEWQTGLFENDEMFL